MYICKMCKIVSELPFHSFTTIAHHDLQWHYMLVGRDYGAEEMLRRKIFADNVKAVDRHNSLHQRGLRSFRTTVNKFADMVRYCNLTSVQFVQFAISCSHRRIRRRLHGGDGGNRLAKKLWGRCP